MRIPTRFAVALSALAFAGTGAALAAAPAQAATPASAMAVPTWGDGGSFILDDCDTFIFEDDDDFGGFGGF